MSALSTHDALSTAECPGCGHSPFQHHIAGGCTVTTYGLPEDGFQPSDNCRCDRGADDALLASGAVIDAATLLPSEFPVTSGHLRQYAEQLEAGHYHTAANVFRVLAAALTEREQA